MELLVPFAILALVAFPFAVDQLGHELRRQQVCAAARECGVVFLSAFNARYHRRRLEVAIVFRTPEAPRSGDRAG